MKHLWFILLFLNPCFSQFSEKSFKIERGEDVFIIAANKKIKINNNSVFYKSINYKNEQLIVRHYNSKKGISENVKIHFNQIKSITFRPSYFYRALKGFGIGFFVGGIAGYFLYEHDSYNLDVPFSNLFLENLERTGYAIGVGLVIGAGGSIIRLATNPEYHLNIGHNDWQIK